MTDPIRVLVVDDHPMIREGVISLLGREDDMVVVGEAADGAEFMSKFAMLRPDITLMDMQMRGMGGLQAIEAIRSGFPDARILVLTTYPGDARAAAAMRAGAAGYLLKSGIRRELPEAIRAIHAGKKTVSAEILTEFAVHALDEPLSEREIAILQLIAGGAQNKVIATRLGVSVDTVKAHLKNAFAKLDVDDRTHAVTTAIRRGYLAG